MKAPAGSIRAASPVAIEPGMILSDEPGYYLPGAYGMRLENLLLVREAVIPGASKPFLGFETLTLAPFERRLIESGLLGSAERLWVDSYHARVFATLSAELDPPARDWLGRACAPLDADTHHRGPTHIILE